MRSRGTDLVVAAGASVGLGRGRARQRPHEPVLPPPLLDALGHDRCPARSGVHAEAAARLAAQVTSGHQVLHQRSWRVATVAELAVERGEEPESLDKEPVRLALDALGYNGDGSVPLLNDAIISATPQRYVTAYTRLTGRVFEPGEYPVQHRLEKIYKVMESYEA